MCIGYVAIGFSVRAGRMGPADSCAGWVDANGTAHVVDLATTRRDVVMSERQQDCHVLSGSSKDGVLSITFWRYLDTNVCVQCVGIVLLATTSAAVAIMLAIIFTFPCLGFF